MTNGNELQLNGYYFATCRLNKMNQTLLCGENLSILLSPYIYLKDDVII